MKKKLGGAARRTPRGCTRNSTGQIGLQSPPRNFSLAITSLYQVDRGLRHSSARGWLHPPTATTLAASTEGREGGKGQHGLQITQHTKKTEKKTQINTKKKRACVPPGGGERAAGCRSSATYRCTNGHSKAAIRPGGPGEALSRRRQWAGEGVGGHPSAGTAALFPGRGRAGRRRRADGPQREAETVGQRVGPVVLQQKPGMPAFRWDSPKPMVSTPHRG